MLICRILKQTHPDINIGSLIAPSDMDYKNGIVKRVYSISHDSVVTEDYKHYHLDDVIPLIILVVDTDVSINDIVYYTQHNYLSKAPRRVRMASERRVSLDKGVSVMKENVFKVIRFHSELSKSFISNVLDGTFKDKSIVMQSIDLQKAS